MSHVIYQHYRKEEYRFIEQVEEWCQRVVAQYVPHNTHFLTPREKLIVEQITARYEEVAVMFYGGFEGAENVRAYIYPAYYGNVDQGDVGVTVYEIEYPHKFSTLKHGQILGTFMSFGVERNRIGDIVSENNRWYIALESEMSSFFVQQVEKIGRVGVSLVAVVTSEAIVPTIQQSEQTITVSSLRLDAVVSTVYRISRQLAKDLIAHQKVKINYKLEERADVVLESADLVSVRQYGRFWVKQMEGTTKKDKIRLKIIQIVH